MELSGEKLLGIRIKAIDSMFSNTSRYGVLFSSAMAVFLFVACGQQQPGAGPGQAVGGAVRIQARTVIKYARGFRIDYYD